MYPYVTIHIREDYLEQYQYHFTRPVSEWQPWSHILLAAISLAAWSHGKGHYGGTKIIGGLDKDRQADYTAVIRWADVEDSNEIEETK